MSLEPPAEFDGQIETITVAADTYATALRAAAEVASRIEDQMFAVRDVRSEQDASGKVKLVLKCTKP